MGQFDAVLRLGEGFVAGAGDFLGLGNVVFLLVDVLHYERTFPNAFSLLIKTVESFLRCR